MSIKNKLEKPLFYNLNDKIKIEVFNHSQDIWISENELPKLVGKDKNETIKYLEEKFKTDEVLKDLGICEKIEEINFYNLETILFICYYLNEKEGIKFRAWIEKICETNDIKGYSSKLREIEYQKTKNTPLDYSANKIWVYFELGGAKNFNPEFIYNKIDFITDKKHIIQTEYGFNLFICNQQILEITRILSNDMAFYQITRI